VRVVSWVPERWRRKPAAVVLVAGALTAIDLGLLWTFGRPSDRAFVSDNAAYFAVIFILGAVVVSPDNSTRNPPER
jgi:hypothetical protein